MRSIILVSVLFLTACATKPSIQTIALADLDNVETHINPNENKLTVIYFLSPECPLCINYTLAMRNLENAFASDSLKFYGVFSKEWFSAEEVNTFQLKYELDFEMLFDTKNTLANALSASVTPEVFVLNSKSEVLYSGKIDNWVNDLGKKKLEVSENYLQNALVASLAGNDFEPKQTEPIGCLIE